MLDKKIFSILVLAMPVLLAGIVSAYLPQAELQRLCLQRTGLPIRDIGQRKIRNEK